MSTQRRKLKLRQVNCLAKEGPALLGSHFQCQLCFLYQARKCGPRTPLPLTTAALLTRTVCHAENVLCAVQQGTLATLIADHRTCGFTAQELDF